MRVCGDSANLLLAREHRSREFRGLCIALRQHVRVDAHRRHGRGVSEASGDDVQRDAAGQHVRRVRWYQADPQYWDHATGRRIGATKSWPVSSSPSPPTCFRRGRCTHRRRPRLARGREVLTICSSTSAFIELVRVDDLVVTWRWCPRRGHPATPASRFRARSTTSLPLRLPLRCLQPFVREIRLVVRQLIDCLPHQAESSGDLRSLLFAFHDTRRIRRVSEEGIAKSLFGPPVLLARVTRWRHQPCQHAPRCMPRKPHRYAVFRQAGRTVTRSRGFSPRFHRRGV
jgi:hypothetical protein